MPLARPVTVMLVSGPSVKTVRSSLPVGKTAYPTIGAPVVGAFQDTIAWRSPRTAVTSVGAPGAVAGGVVVVVVVGGTVVVVVVGPAATVID